MALSKNYIKNISGKDVMFENAYIQIATDNGNKNMRNIRVIIYDSNAKSNIIDEKFYNYIPDISDTAKNFLKQGYESLKALDEFKDSVDLLDEGQTA